MPEDLDGALQQLRPLLLDPDMLVRAVAAGQRRRPPRPWRTGRAAPDRPQGRPAPAGRHLRRAARPTHHQPRVRRSAPRRRGRRPARRSRSATGTCRRPPRPLQLRVTKKGLTRSCTGPWPPAQQHTDHDRAKPAPHRPGRPAVHGARRRRQQASPGRRVPAHAAGRASSRRRPARPTGRCGSSTSAAATPTSRFAAYRFLADDRSTCGSPASTCGRRCASATTRSPPSSAGPDTMRFEAGADRRRAAAEARGRRRARAARLRHRHRRRARPGRPLERPGRARLAVLPPRPAAPDVRPAATPAPYGLVTRHAILRERLGDVLTDAVRAALLRRVGYRVEVVQFVSAEYTPRNTMIRAVRTARRAPPDTPAPTRSTTRWSPTGASRPHLQTLLADDLAARR